MTRQFVERKRLNPENYTKAETGACPHFTIIHVTQQKMLKETIFL
jgi:hypothetical protein